MPSSDITTESILKLLDALAPFALAEAWDNVGLLVGAPGNPVTGILIGLDPTAALLDEALARGANLVITHHPLIFPSLKAIRTDQPTGAVIAKALANSITIIACHTNLDVVPHGVSHALSQHLGMTGTVPLKVERGDAPEIGFGAVGTLSEPVSGVDFLARLGRALNLPAIAVAGAIPDVVERVAVCGGSGSDLAMAARAQGAQVFVSAEVKHHIARWAEEIGFCVIDGGHFATEARICEALASMLRAQLASQGVFIPVLMAEQQNNPFSFFITGNDQ